MYRLYRLNKILRDTTGIGRSFLPLFYRRFTSSCTRRRDYIQPRRAILYVPGHDRRKIEKVRTLDVDCAVIDCEDGVAVNMKSTARDLISQICENFDFGRSEYAVRINSIDSGLADDDLNSILNGKRIPQAVMVPKVESVDHILWIAEKFKKYSKQKYLEKISLVIFVESAKSLLNLQHICEKACELSQSNLFNFEGIVFGSDDFCADIGATRSNDGAELLTARQTIVIIAKCFKLQAIDMVHIDYTDFDGLLKSAEQGANFGFTGKQVIHPSQVSIVQRAFSPSKERIEWAKELIKQFQLHQDEGKGAFIFRGVMVDKPLLLQAQNIIRMAEMISH